MDREWYSDDPEWQKSHQDADSARAEQRAAREYQTQREQAEREQMARDSSVESAREEQLAAQKYLEQREREQKAYDLSTEAAIDEKLAMRAQVAIQSNLEYTENIWDRAYGVIDKWSQNDPSNKELLDQVDKWVSENIRTTSAVQEGWTEIEDTEQLIHAVEDFFQSRDSEYPMQVQFVVDTEEEMAVCRMIHLGKIGLDMYEVFKLASKGIAVTAASVSTLGFGAVLGAAFLGAATKKGISLATDIAYAIQDEMTYKETGQVIVTMGIESKSPVGKLAYALF